MRISLIFSLIVTTFGLVSCYMPTDMPSSRTQLHSTNSLAIKNYAALQEALYTYEQASRDPWVIIPNKDPIGLIRHRLIMTHDLTNTSASDPDEMDESLYHAIQSFQLRHGLTPDGHIGPATLAELNVPPSERIKQIRLNMQRWAKVAEQVSDRYLMVNVPAYQVTLFDHNQPVLSMKAIVGRPDRPTPELSSNINRIIFNPYWHVPAQIAQKDILPKIQQDPQYLNNMKIKVIQKTPGKTVEVNNNDIDWQKVERDGLVFDFRQEPGDNNSLGAVKFEFPNGYDVYLHDTPAKNLFAATTRDLSSGCIRLEKPFLLVNYLMQNNPEWPNQKIDAIVQSKKTTYVNVPTPLPIVITYITAWVNDQGRVNFSNDIYHRDN